MPYRPRGRVADDPRLGRYVPDDWEHTGKYPLTARTTPARPVPMVLGINWYSNFDRPEKIGRTWWVGRGDLGAIRGGHAIATLPTGYRDYLSWWDYYDQLSEGRCVEFAWHRVLTLLNRHRYDIVTRWAYFLMQNNDEWAGGAYPGATPHYEGTSVRAGGWVHINHGPRRQWGQGEKARVSDPQPEEGIAVYRWATSWDDVREVNGVSDDRDGVPLLNSWGRAYPHIVRITDEAGARVLDEYGEAAVPTDR